MIFKYIKKKKILFFILFFLLSITILILIKELRIEDKPSLIKTETKEVKLSVESKPKTIQKVLAENRKETELKKQNKDNLSNIPILNDQIDFIGKNDPMINPKPISEIDQIMQEQKKIDTFTQEKHLTKKPEGWKVDYGVGLENGAIDDLKAQPTLKPKMLNGKVGFSTSF